MKHFILFILSFILCVCVCGCSNKQTVASADDAASYITYEIEQLEGFESFDTETIKTLSGLYQSNYTKNKSLFKNNGYKNEYIYNIVKEETKNQTTTYDKYFIFNNNNDWSKEISKADILKFLSNKGISLVSVKHSKPVFEQNSVVAIEIGENQISISEIVSAFNLPSANITNIEDKTLSIVVFGQIEENGVSIDPKSVNKMAKSGKNKAEILKSLDNDFYLITKNK